MNHLPKYSVSYEDINKNFDICKLATRFSDIVYYSSGKDYLYNS